MHHTLVKKKKEKKGNVLLSRAPTFIIAIVTWSNIYISALPADSVVTFQMKIFFLRATSFIWLPNVLSLKDIILTKRSKTLQRIRANVAKTQRKRECNTYPGVKSTCEATSPHWPPAATGLHDSHASDAWAITHYTHFRPMNYFATHWPIPFTRAYAVRAIWGKRDARKTTSNGTKTLFETLERTEDRHAW